MDSFDVEAQKLGLMGVTIIVSSGDNGVAGYGCKSGCNSQQPSSSTNCVCGLSSSSSSSVWTGSNTWTGAGYIPKFPATSPYVTVVGGTAGPEIGDAEVTSQSDHNNVITSGGGFSGYNSQPSWQTFAVADYFAKLQSSPPQGFNNKVILKMLFQLALVSILQVFYFLFSERVGVIRMSAL
jgi:tripeptidyl-peptidase I